MDAATKELSSEEIVKLKEAWGTCKGALLLLQSCRGELSREEIVELAALFGQVVDAATLVCEHLQASRLQLGPPGKNWAHWLSEYLRDPRADEPIENLALLMSRNGHDVFAIAKSLRSLGVGCVVHQGEPYYPEYPVITTA